MKSEELKPGQIFKVKNPKYNYFTTGDHFIILSTGEACNPDTAWRVGNFWFSVGVWGGARQHELGPKEIFEMGEYVGYLPDLLPVSESSGAEKDRDFEFMGYNITELIEVIHFARSKGYSPPPAPAPESEEVPEEILMDSPRLFPKASKELAERDYKRINDPRSPSTPIVQPQNTGNPGKTETVWPKKMGIGECACSEQCNCNSHAFLYNEAIDLCYKAHLSIIQKQPRLEDNLVKLNKLQLDELLMGFTNTVGSLGGYHFQDISKAIIKRFGTPQLPSVEQIAECICENSDWRETENGNFKPLAEAIHQLLTNGTQKKG